MPIPEEGTIFDICKCRDKNGQYTEFSKAMGDYLRREILKDNIGKRKEWNNIYPLALNLILNGNRECIGLIDVYTKEVSNKELSNFNDLDTLDKYLESITYKIDQLFEEITYKHVNKEIKTVRDLVIEPLTNLRQKITYDYQLNGEPNTDLFNKWKETLKNELTYWSEVLIENDYANYADENKRKEFFNKKLTPAFCHNCGKRFEPKEQVCSNCGEDLNERIKDSKSL